MFALPGLVPSFESTRKAPLRLPGPVAAFPRLSPSVFDSHLGSAAAAPSVVTAVVTAVITAVVAIVATAGWRATAAAHGGAAATAGRGAIGAVAVAVGAVRVGHTRLVLDDDLTEPISEHHPVQRFLSLDSILEASKLHEGKVALDVRARKRTVRSEGVFQVAGPGAIRVEVDHEERRVGLPLGHFPAFLLALLHLPVTARELNPEARC
mmetsp:Transcript_52085/g.108729  ORF Transcript_52085/g.108729 Transcript_52085/m.108729 type:complete len:209 (-) Transcript_52085:1260-1886(-)